MLRTCNWGQQRPQRMALQAYLLTDLSNAL